ncbi:MAG TPA: hypothetical protein VKV15_26035 [Bryobacteraceae bacterium]|jgi:hypothetical protein|nr:hypothetical protein [Bryobacteraceae bacterium]
MAAVVMDVFHRFEQRNRSERRSDIVDYADIATALRPYLRKELLLARADELRKIREASRNALVAREGTLMQELADVEAILVAGKK